MTASAEHPEFVNFSKALWRGKQDPTTSWWDLFSKHSNIFKGCIERGEMQPDDAIERIVDGAEDIEPGVTSTPAFVELINGLQRTERIQANGQDAHIDPEPPPHGEQAAEVRKTPAYSFEIVPYDFPDLLTLPKRQILFAGYYVRGDMGATIAGGGRGKTTLGLVEVVGISAGRDLLTGIENPMGPLRVAFLSGEESQLELDRRLGAIFLRYGIRKADVGDRLFVHSVRSTPIRFAYRNKNKEAVIDFEVMDRFIAMIKKWRVDIWMIDPFIRFHRVTENDNEHIDLLVQECLARICEQTDTAGEGFHHTGKSKPGQVDMTSEDGRGASSLIWAMRRSRVANFMKSEEATKLMVDFEQRRFHIRIDGGKNNPLPPTKAMWVKLTPISLPNGDEVATLEKWAPPDPFDGVAAPADVCSQVRELVRIADRTGKPTLGYRTDMRSPDWIGWKVAELLKINIVYRGQNNEKELNRVKTMVGKWFHNHVLEQEPRVDTDGKTRSCVKLGDWNEPAPSHLKVVVDNDTMPEEFDP